MANIGRYSKFIVAVIGLATATITTYYGSATWAIPAVSALSALAVLLVPNQPAGKP